MFFEVFFGWLAGHALGIAAHEAGHAFAAMATGMRVKKVVIGWGETLYACEYRGIQIELNRIPSGGVTHIAGEIRLRKWAELFVLLAGSLGNLLLLLGVVAAWYHSLLPSSADYVTLGFVCAQIFLIAFALLPDAASVAGGITDGKRIAFILKQKNGSLTPVAECHLHSLQPYAEGEGQIAALSPASHRLIDIHQALCHSPAELPGKTVQAVIAELGKDEMSPAEELMVLDTLVTNAVIYGNRNLRDSIDEWSSRAMARGSHISTIRFTRAAVLIELGRFADGKALIEASAHPDDRPYDTVLNSIFLAKAEAGLGNPGRANELLAQAGIRIRDEFPSTLQPEMQSLWQRTTDSLAAKP